MSCDAEKDVAKRASPKIVLSDPQRFANNHATLILFSRTAAAKADRQ
jgi:hypothetical protein